MNDIIEEEPFEDAEGKKIRQVHRQRIDGKPRISILHVEPSPEYIENVQKPMMENLARIRKTEADGLKVCNVVKQLGRARTKEPERIEAENVVLNEMTGIIVTDNLDEIIAQLVWFANKTPQQIDSYIDSNITGLDKVKDFLKLNTRALWGLVNVVRMLAKREVPLPEEP